MLNMHFQTVQDKIWQLGTALNGSKQFFVLSFLFIPFLYLTLYPELVSLYRILYSS